MLALSNPHINTHILCQRQALQLCRLIKSWKAGQSYWICITREKSRSPWWSERAKSLLPPCPLTHRYLMPTESWSGYLSRSSTVVNKKTSNHQVISLRVVYCDLIWLNAALWLNADFSIVLNVFFCIWCFGFISFLCDGRGLRYVYGCVLKYFLQSRTIKLCCLMLVM